MEIPYTELSDEALQAIIEEFITREGTEHGDREFALADKVAQVKQQIVAGRVRIDFDLDNQTCQLVDNS